MLKTHHWRTYYYGNFAPEDGGGRESSRVDPANPGNVTWRTFDHRPRFGNNYAGLRNRIAILSEAYSYLDFKGRIEVTEDFVEEIWKSAAANAKQIMTLTAQADRVFTAPANGKPVELGVDIEIRALPEKVEIMVGDVTKVPNPRSGRDMLVMAPLAMPVLMKDYGVFAATRTLAMPKGWLIPKALADGAASRRRARSPALARHPDPGDRRRRAAGRRALFDHRDDEGAEAVPGPPGSAAARARSTRRSSRCPRDRCSFRPTSRWRGWRSICSSPRATTAS